MENRYQQFLKNTLQSGLWELKKNPEATEAAGVPLPTFDVLVRAFRSGLVKELEITLPHNLNDPAYLEALLSKIDILLSSGIPETVTSANLPNVRELMTAYQEAEKFNGQIVANQQKWQATFDNQIKKYNHDLINGLHQQLEQELPSLPREKREILVKDLARTIQDQVLPAITFNDQTRTVLKDVVRQTLQQYASEIEELESVELTARPQAVEEIATRIAKEQEAATWETRSAQISATVLPNTYKLESVLRTAVTANLPAELSQDSELVEEITREIMARVHMAGERSEEDYQTYLAQQVQAILTQTNVARLLEEKGIVATQVEKIATTVATPVAEQITPEIYKVASSPEFAQTPLAGGMAALSMVQPIPSIRPVQTIPQPWTDSFDDTFRERFDEAWVASQPTDFLFFGLSSPGWKTIPTSILGLTMDIAGIVPPAHTSMIWGYLSYNEKDLASHIAAYNRNASLLAGKDPRTATAYQSMANFLSGVLTFKEKTPGFLKPFVFAGEVYGRIQRFNMLLAGPTGISPLKILELTARYGGPGFSYGTEMMLKIVASRLLGAGLHAALPKLFLYDKLGQEVYFKYGPKGITKWARGKIFEFGKKTFGAGVKSVATKILTKLGLSALLGTLSGGASFVVQGAWYLLKKLWKWLAGALGLFLFWLIGQLGGLASLLLSITGGIIGFILSGGNLLVAAGGAIALPTIAILGKGLLGSLGSAFFGPGGLITNFSLPSLTGYAILAPITFAGLGIGTMVIMIPIMSAFVDYQQSFAPIFFSDCRVDDIHKTNVITPENKAVFVAKFMALFPNSLLEKKIDEVISRSQAIGFNPALAVAIWGEESHFSNYGEETKLGLVEPGYDLGCGPPAVCGNKNPKNFDESLACFANQNINGCNNLCLNKPDFASFMECYGPVTDNNENFISNVLSLYRDLVPSGEGAIVCPGGTTSEYASRLLNALIACYDHSSVINETSFQDSGACLVSKGISQQAASLIAGSVSTYKALQCVGFAQAVEAATGGKLQQAQQTPYGSAKDYYRRGVPGYQNIPKSQKNVRIGDIAVWDGVDGHMGVVIDVASDMSWFRVAQAIGTDDQGKPNGLINESGQLLITTPNLLGFLRRQ